MTINKIREKIYDRMVEINERLFRLQEQGKSHTLTFIKLQNEYDLLFEMYNLDIHKS